MSDGQSPMSNHGHRMSVGSTGPFPPMQHLHAGSIDGSDPASPGSLLGPGSLPGDNAGTFHTTQQRSVTSQPPEESRAKSDSQKDGDGTPAWAELKTKAGKERKRLPLACIACRRKKIRCSGEKPACKHCLRSRIPCVYKVTTRKAAPRTDYMAMLDKRLKRMEERVIKIMPKDEQRNVDVIGRAVVKPALPGLPAKPGADKKRAADEAFGDELNEWSKARPATGAKGGARNATSSAKADRAKDSLLLDGAESLPSQELQQHLAEVFFDFVYGQGYHLLHKPSYMRKLDAGQLPPVLSLAVCAISARFSSHPDVRTEPAFLRGEQWAKPARDIALKRYDTPNITLLISWIILGLHEFGTCQGGRSWMLGGMAQRMAYALQLHKDLEDDGPQRGGPEESAKLTFTDREIRRRTMWACFMMDRFNSSGTNRPLFVSEQYIQAQLPIKEHYFQMEITGPTENLEGSVSKPVEPDTGQVTDPKDNMGVAAYMIRLVAMWGLTIRYLNMGGKERDKHPIWAEKSVFQELVASMEAWKKGLPASLHWTPENLQNHASEKIANQFILLHITANQIVLFMNRFALPYPGFRPSFQKDMPQPFLTSCGRAALEAANQISSLVNEAMDYRVVAPFAGYCAFLSSTVHIHGVFSKNPALEASSKQYLAWNVKYLSKMKKYWGMFHFVAENLKDLYRRHADAALRGSHAATTPSGQKPQDAIFQYGDWFDRYPHGVSGTDYEDPATEVKREPGSDAVLGQKSDLQSVEEFFSKLSPPSKAGQQKKAARKRRTKSEAQNTQHPDAAATQDQQMQQVSQVLQQQQQQQHPAIPMPNLDAAMLDSAYGSNLNFNPSAAQSFPPGLSPAMPLLQAQNQQQQQRYQQHPGVLSQLDRHMVLSSYAGVDPSTNPSFNMNQTAADPSNALNTLDANPFDLDMNNAFNFAPAWDASDSWFMPFNMEPPNTLGDDTGFFGSTGYDFAGLGMQGFGDLGGPLDAGLEALDHVPHNPTLGGQGGGSVEDGDGLMDQ